MRSVTFASSRPTPGCQPVTMQMPPAAYLADNERFKRLAEPKGGVLCQGGYGKVFQGYDVLLGQQVTIKRQSSDDESVGREAATYRMLTAYSHPNIIRMKGMFVSPYLGSTYLYIAMESCSTSLWRELAVDNLRVRETLLRPMMPPRYLLGIAKGLSHLHRLDVAHGDLSLSNILLTWDHKVRICDFGTAHPAHSYVTPDKFCVTYIRPPEAVAGSLEKGAAVDVWAVGVMTVAIFTRRLPFLPPTANAGSDEEGRRFAFLAAAKLLPGITDATWPDHDKLTKWASLKSDYEAVSPKGTLHSFMSSFPKRLPDGNDEPPKVIAARMLQWDPAKRPLMHEVVEYVEQSFTFPQEDEDETCRKKKQAPVSSSDTEGSIEGGTTKRRSSSCTDGRKSGNLKTTGTQSDKGEGLPARKRRIVASQGNTHRSDDGNGEPAHNDGDGSRRQ